LNAIEDAKLYKLSSKEHEAVEIMKKKMIIGDFRQVKHKLLELQQQYNTDEVMIVTNTYSPKDRIRSYELIAEGLL
jgi:hypothetical protein